MPIETDADRLNLLIDWGTAIYTPQGGGTSTVSGVFFNAYIESSQIAGRAPVWLGRTIDLPGITTEALLQVEGVEYRVAVIQPDGTGMTRCVLQQVITVMLTDASGVALTDSDGAALVT